MRLTTAGGYWRRASARRLLSRGHGPKAISIIEITHRDLAVAGDYRSQFGTGLRHADLSAFPPVSDITIDDSRSMPGPGWKEQRTGRTAAPSTLSGAGPGPGSGQTRISGGRSRPPCGDLPAIGVNR
jgi:hypothetical protein